MIAPMIAIAGNSPFFMGQALCSESRIAIFDSVLNEKNQESRVFLPTEIWQDASLNEYFAKLMEYRPWLSCIADEPVENLWHCVY